MRSVLGKALMLGLAVAATSIAGCSSDAKPSTSGHSTGATGDIGLQLQIGGTTVTSVHYVIDNGTNHYEGNLDVADASHLLAVIGGIQAGSGYTLTLSATGTNGTPCSGTSAQFTVVANSTVIVGIQLLCQFNNDAGSVKIEGTVGECANFGSVSAAVPSGNTIQISTTTIPTNPVPAVVYTWSGAGASGLSSTSSANPVYTCNNSGTTDQQVDLDLTISQGTTTVCNKTFHLIIDCPPGTSGTGGTGGGAGTGGTGGSTGGTGGATGGTGGAAGGTGGSTGGTGGGTGYHSGCADNDCYSCIVDDNGGVADPCAGLTGTAAAGPGAGQAKADLCRATLDCIRSTGCHANAVSDCYCGTAIDLGTCNTATNIPMPGSCKTQMDASLEVPAGSAGGVALGRITDASYAGGLAGITATFENSSCPLQCLPFTCSN